MDMNIFQASKGDTQMANFAVQPDLPARSELIPSLRAIADTGRLQAGLRTLTDYVGASHYLLARCDLIQENGLDFIVSSNWPFDLVKDVANNLVAALGGNDGDDRIEGCGGAGGNCHHNLRNHCKK